MSRARIADEKKMCDAFVKNVSNFTWNAGTFGACLTYEHPVVQARSIETFIVTLKMLADQYIHGRFDDQNAEEVHAAYVMYGALLDNPETKALPFVTDF